MKRSLNIVFCLSMLILLLSACSDGSGNASKGDAETPGSATVMNNKPVNTNTVIKKAGDELNISACYPPSDNNDDSPQTQPVAWWNNWPRFSPADLPASRVFVMNANAVSSAGGDQGWSAYFRTDAYKQYENYYKVPDGAPYDVKRTVWMESMGTMVGFLGEVAVDGNGNYIIDPITGAPQLLKNHWTWYQPGQTLSPNNKVVWIGLHAYGEEWQGKYARGNGVDELPVPTYPDGTPAIGYFDGDSSDPRKSKFYDALAVKDINGNPWIDFQATREERPGTLQYVGEDNNTYYASYFTSMKDVASPWFLEYNRQAARFFLERGLDGFWVDHSMGYNYAIESSLHKGFGEWSVATFRDYLSNAFTAQELSGLGITDVSAFDVRTYLKNKFRTWFNKNPDNLSQAEWSSPRWNDEPIWKAYISHKAKIAATRAQQLYDMIKDEAVKLGKQKDDILVFGNDITRVHVPGITGKEMDLVSAEYMPHYSVATQNFKDGLLPDGHSGPYYAIAAQAAQGRHAITWYYLPNEVLSGQEQLAQLISYEAIANNVIITGGTSPLFTALPGNDNSALAVNNFIERMSPEFGMRERYATVGLVYSTESEYSYMAPGGYRYKYGKDAVAPGDLPSVLEYYGWGTAFEDLHIPYRTISDYKLTTESLSGLSVLILPLVESISQQTVDQVLVPFVEAGGTLIVVGEEAGKLDTSSNNYRAHNTPILAGLVNRTYNKGQVMLVPKQPSSLEGPGGNYYRAQSYNEANSVLANSMLTKIRNIMDGLCDDGTMARQVELTGFNDNTVTVLNYDRSGKKFFVDLVNRHFNVQNDSPVQNPGGTVKVKLPPALALTGPNFTVDMYVPEQQQPIRLTSVVQGNSIEITVPAFQMYASLIVR